MTSGRQFFGVFLMFGFVVALTAAALLATRAGDGDERSHPVSSTPRSEPAQAAVQLADSPNAQLDADLNMTRFMSQPDSLWTAMTTGRARDGQLERSLDPGYVRELEQQQADIDRMLATPPR